MSGFSEYPKERYAEEKKIGEGSYGVVVKAFDGKDQKVSGRQTITKNLLRM